MRRFAHPLWKGERYFRWRGGAVSRLEGLTDAAFAFAMTLIVVSLEVPSSYRELEQALITFPVFGACFALLLWCWHVHFRYHRRFGFEDLLTVAINGLLLFVILLYIYPLKFVAVMMFGELFLGAEQAATVDMSRDEGRRLMVLYSGGFSAIFALFASMYHLAWRRRKVLELDEVEAYITRREMCAHLLSVAVGLSSVAIAVLQPQSAGLSGLVYFLLGPIHGIYGWRTGVGVERLAGESEAA